MIPTFITSILRFRSIGAKPPGHTRGGFIGIPLVPTPQSLKSKMKLLKNTRNSNEKRSDDISIHVHGYFLNTPLEFSKVEKYFHNSLNVQDLQLSMKKTRSSLVVKLQEPNVPSFSIVEKVQSMHDMDEEQDPCVPLSETSIKGPSYVSFQSFGSVVFFNVSSRNQSQILENIFMNKFALDSLPSDHMSLTISPSLKTWVQPSKSSVSIQSLNSRGVELIGQLLSQSVALDYYEKLVDDKVDYFGHLNELVRNSGAFNKKPKDLFQLVADTNHLYRSIFNLGILSRSDTAWHFPKYWDLWEYLYDEFEIQDRFERIDWKISLVQQNVKFFMEIGGKQKSDFLEWMIIALIATEIVVSLYDIYIQLALAPDPDSVKLVPSLPDM